MQSRKFVFLIVSFLRFVNLVSPATLSTNRLEEKFSWKVIDFDYPNEEARNEAIKSGEFIPENNMPVGIERWRNKLFVTIPQLKVGTPATLTYIDLDATSNRSPKLKPYPNWEAHQIRKNNGISKIVNVYRVDVDVCDRLWFIDTGMVDLAGKRELVYPPTIQAYDLNSDRLILEYPLPRNVYRNESLFANIIVDVSKDNCNDAYVYIADIRAFTLLVYHFESNVAWTVSHPFFSFDPLSTDFNVGGINFQWRDGIFGLALSPPQSDGSRLLYFHPSSSTQEFAVSNAVIRNKTSASNQYHAYKALGSRGRKSESTAESFDNRTGVLFYTLFHNDAIGCWNTKNSFTAANHAILARDPVTMSFPNDLKVDKNGTLWVLSDRLPNFVYAKLNYDEANFRIFSASTEQLIKGTVCDTIVRNEPQRSKYPNNPRPPLWSPFVWNPSSWNTANKQIPFHQPGILNKKPQHDFYPTDTFDIHGKFPSFTSKNYFPFANNIHE